MKLLSVDPLGQAVHDYFFYKTDYPLTIISEGFDNDIMHASYFFRSLEEMPILEQEALNLCRGKILDVGACAGTHSLWLQKRGFDVTALEVSKQCCDVMQQQGIRNVVQCDIFKYNEGEFDTILLLMNGTGIAGSLSHLYDLFVHLGDLLRDGGQILIDSSDLIYLYEDEDGYIKADFNEVKYYGELKYQFEYKQQKSEPFPWLYVDKERIKQIVSKSGFKVKQIINGNHYDYLAQLEKNIMDL